MKLSIIIPVFNEEKRIGDFLSMLESQTSKPEIVIVDGGSKDRTVEIIKGFQKKMKNVKLYTETGEFRSPANARNIGLENATGEIALFQDVDVVFSPKFTETIEKEFERHKEYKIIRFTTKPLKPKSFKSIIDKAYYFRDYSRWIANNHYTIMRREITPTFDVSLGYGEDKIWAKKTSDLLKKHSRYETKTEISNFVHGPISLEEVWKRYKWYGRTGMFYYNKSKDRTHLVKLALAVLSIPFIFTALIPMARGLFYSVRIAKEYPEGLVLIPLVEALAFPAMAVGFWEYVIKKKSKSRGH